MKKIVINKTNATTGTQDHPNLRKPTEDVNAPSKVYRVRVKNVFPFDGFYKVTFVHLDFPNITNAETMELPNGSSEAILCDGVPLPQRNDLGLVVSLFNSPLTSSMFYIATYATSKPKPIMSSGEQIVGDQNTGVFLNKQNKSIVLGADSTKIELKDKVKMTSSDAEMSFDRTGILITDEKGNQRFRVTDDAALLKSSGKVTIATIGNMEFVANKFIFKDPMDLGKKASEVSSIEFNGKDRTEVVSGELGFGASKFSLNLTDPSLDGGPVAAIGAAAGILKNALEIKTLRGHNHFQVGNGDFKITLLDNEPNPLLNRKFKIEIGKMSMVNKAEFSMDSKGFTIASGKATLKLSRYVINFRDDMLMTPTWEIGYRGNFKMSIGIQAKGSLIPGGKSTMDIIADKIYLGDIRSGGSTPVINDGGNVLTTLTDPVADYITGIKHKGSRSVFAIS